MSNLPKVGDNLEFNTGRGYTPEGQIVQAQVVALIDSDILDDEKEVVVHFHDTSRNIMGQVVVWDFNERSIMDRYDNGTYTEVWDSQYGAYESDEVEQVVEQAVEQVADEDDWKMRYEIYFAGIEDRELAAKIQAAAALNVGETMREVGGEYWELQYRNIVCIHDNWEEYFSDHKPPQEESAEAIKERIKQARDPFRTIELADLAAELDRLRSQAPEAFEATIDPSVMVYVLDELQGEIDRIKDAVSDRGEVAS